MAENREEIIDRIETALNAIDAGSGGTGYRTTVDTVSREFREYDKVGDSEFPFVCYFPSPEGQQTPEHLFGGRHHFLDVTVIGHVQASAQDAKTHSISDLEADITDCFLGNASRSITSNATWGGYAVETLKVQDPETDEGVPEKAGLKGPTCSVRLRFRMDWYV